jgi:hypothetical protein
MIPARCVAVREIRPLDHSEPGSRAGGQDKPDPGRATGVRTDRVAVLTLLIRRADADLGAVVVLEAIAVRELADGDREADAAGYRDAAEVTGLRCLKGDRYWPGVRAYVLGRTENGQPTSSGTSLSRRSRHRFTGPDACNQAALTCRYNIRTFSGARSSYCRSVSGGRLAAIRLAHSRSSSVSSYSALRTGCDTPETSGLPCGGIRSRSAGGATWSSTPS